MVVRANDLPVSWDGEPVDWCGWGDEPWTTWIFHHKPVPCVCGSVAPQQVNAGAIDEVTIGKTFSVVRLFAYRCPGCSLDTVVDLRAGTTWELDETDYGSGGSEVTQKELF